jgi:hypothetical protein
MFTELPVAIDGLIVVAALTFAVSAIAGFLLARPSLRPPRGVRRPGWRRGGVSTDPGAPVGPA